MLFQIYHKPILLKKILPHTEYGISQFFSEKKPLLEQINDLMEPFLNTGMRYLEFSTTTNSQLFNYNLIESEWRNLYKKYTDLKSACTTIDNHMQELIHYIINEFKENNLILSKTLKIQNQPITVPIKDDSDIDETLFKIIYGILSQEPHINDLLFTDEKNNATQICLTKGDKRLISLNNIQNKEVEAAETNCINYIGHIFSLPKKSSCELGRIIYASKHRIQVKAI